MNKDDRFLKTKMLIGEESFLKISCAHVAVFGLGGVGCSAVEALARSGIEKFDVFDGDIVDTTNINRQIIALSDTVGEPKVQVTKSRILNINPGAEINPHFCFFDKSNCDSYDFSGYDYIIDAIDSVTSKLLIIQKAKQLGVPVISSMGTANKLNPCMLEVEDIYKTSVCPLARVMRRELKKRGITCLKTVYSKETPVSACDVCKKRNTETKISPASIAFVPPVAGMIIASEVIKDIIKR